MSESEPLTPELVILPERYSRIEAEAFRAGWKAAHALRAKDPGASEIHYVDLFYPRQNPGEKVVISLVDVRAADDLVVTYDFDRDGYVLTMNDTEVGFVEAWAEDPGASEGLREALYNCGLAAHFGGELMDSKRRGGREKLAYIERTATAALASQSEETP